jgi:multisubunit Na+/H+ antiporter MnhF subunit
MEVLTEFLNQASKLMLMVAILLILYRFRLGPNVFDRLVGFETIGLAVVGYLLVESNATVGRLYTDAALGLALFSVAGTVFLAYFLGRGEFPDE